MTPFAYTTKINIVHLIWIVACIQMTEVEFANASDYNGSAVCNSSTETLTDEATIRLLDSCILPTYKLTEIIKAKVMKAEERLDQIRATVIRPGINKTISKEQDQLLRRARSMQALNLADSLMAVGFQAATKLQKEENIEVESKNIVVDARNMKLPFTFPSNETESPVRLTVRERDGHQHGDSHPAFGVLYDSLHEEITDQIALDEESQNGSQSMKYVINSQVISAKTTCPIEDVTITIVHLNETDGRETRCVFWNSSKGSTANYSIGFWSTRGCSKDLGRSNSTQTVCVCSHLTNFAILMSIGNFQIPKEHEIVLTTISQIGSVISIVFLTIGISLLLLLLSGDVRHTRHMIHLNFMVALLLGEVAFVAGIDATANKAICAAVAVALHYFFLASFGWMLVEGIYLYLHVIKVFAHKSWRLWHYLLFAWGGTGIVVGTTGAISPKSYINSDYCWFSRSGLTLWAFVGPVLVIALVNLGILVAVVFEIVKISNQGGVDAVRVATRSSMLLLPLLGSTWIFGILAFNSETLVFHYAFTVCNTLQGFLVALIYCVLNTEVRVGVKRRMECIIASSWTLALLRSLWNFVTRNGREDSQMNTHHRKTSDKAPTEVSMREIHIRKSSLHPI